VITRFRFSDNGSWCGLRYVTISTTSVWGTSLQAGPGPYTVGHTTTGKRLPQSSSPRRLSVTGWLHACRETEGSLTRDRTGGCPQSQNTLSHRLQRHLQKEGIHLAGETGLTAGLVDGDRRDRLDANSDNDGSDGASEFPATPMCCRLVIFRAVRRRWSLLRGNPTTIRGSATSPRPRLLDGTRRGPTTARPTCPKQLHHRKSAVGGGVGRATPVRSGVGHPAAHENGHAMGPSRSLRRGRGHRGAAGEWALSIMGKGRTTTRALEPGRNHETRVQSRQGLGWVTLKGH